MTDNTVNDVTRGCGICAWSPENAEYRFLFETKFWRIVLAPNQCLVGRCVVHLKRHSGDLADLTEEELIEWLAVVRGLENALRAAFGTTMFNWSCYMNLSYREARPNPHIHWWAVPRYKQPVTVSGLVFEDPHFGNPYDHDRRLEVPAEIHQNLGAQIQQALNLAT